MATRRFFTKGTAAEQKLPRCLRCQQRWPQYAGLCRRCQRELDYFGPNDRKETSAALAFEVELTQAREALPKPPQREIVVHGQVFDVVWDGR